MDFAVEGISLERYRGTVVRIAQNILIPGYELNDKVNSVFLALLEQKTKPDQVEKVAFENLVKLRQEQNKVLGIVGPKTRSIHAKIGPDSDQTLESRLESKDRGLWIYDDEKVELFGPTLIRYFPRDYLRLLKDMIHTEKEVQQVFEQETLEREQILFLLEKIERAIEALPYRQRQKYRTIEDLTKITSTREIKVARREDFLAIYRGVLDGIFPRFPPDFFNKQRDVKTEILIDYALEHLLGKEAKDLSIDNLREIKLFGLYQLYQNMPRMLEAAGNTFAPFKRKAQNLWMRKGKPTTEGLELAGKAIRWMVEDKLGIDPAAAPYVIKRETFGHYGLTVIFQRFFHSSKYQALSHAYPNFYSGDTFPGLKQYQNDEHRYEIAAAITRRHIERTLGFTADEIPRKLRNKHFRKPPLTGLFKHLFGNNLFELVNNAYPGRFREYELFGVKGKWVGENGKKNAKQIVHDIVEHRLKIRPEQVPQHKADIAAVLRQEFRSMMDARNFYFSHRPYKLIEYAYPSV